MIVSPSISPVYNNNPGYSELVLYYDDEYNLKIQSLNFHFWNLMQYILFRSDTWHKIEVMETFGVDLNKVDSIRDLYQRMMNNPIEYSRFEAMQYGLDWISTHFFKWVS